MTGDRAPAPGSGLARVLIVDDHPMFRHGLASLLSGEPGLSVCGEAADVDAAWKEIARLEPHLLVLDLSLPGGDGLDLIKSVRMRYPAIRILVVSMHEESLYAARTLRAGAQGYVNKTEPSEVIVQAVHKVLAGAIHVSPNVEWQIFENVMGAPAHARGSPLEALSDRELQVFNLLGQGKTSSQIAQQLHLSKKTVQTHREHLKLKLHAASASELLRRAVEHQLSHADNPSA